jgi:hypothetical protein
MSLCKFQGQMVFIRGGMVKNDINYILKSKALFSMLFTSIEFEMRTNT